MIPFSFAHLRRLSGSAVLATAALTLAACGGSSSTAETAPQVQRAPEPPSGTTTANSTSANTINSGELRNAQYGRMEDMLARVPGLQVIRNDNGGFTLRIRGIQNFRGDGEPLVVIDGMQVRTGGIASTLSSLQPSDVSRVEVLKDAGSTAFYGSAGVNGVIVITTKRPRQ